MKVLNTEQIESKGSVTLKYIDITTNNEIYPSETINNLQFGNYSYEAKIIYNYKLQNDSIQSVNLTEDDPDQMIIFYYNQIFGTITIEYIDINVNTDIYQPKTIENLSLGTYTYGAINISGYILSDNEIKTVTITEASPNATITFKYEEILGTVTIRYIDNSSSSELSEADTFTDLKLGNYSYTYKDIPGYSLSSNSTQIVELTEDNHNVDIEFKYNKLLGSVTIKYIDSSSLNEIGPATVISNLSLGTYSYTAKSFEGYKIIGDSTQSVTLNDTNINPIISFNYSMISGNITIKYLDSSTLTEIAPSTTMSNIALGNYTIDAIYIDNYEVYGDSSISTNLTTNNPNQTISFKYTKIDIYDDLNWNEVPYISTYYIKPIVKPGEEVFIDYYITDYYHKEYMEEYNLKNDDWGDNNWTKDIWNNETFTVTVRVEGQNDKLYHFLKAGDHQVSLGSFSTEGEQKFSILCTDKYGRNSHELFNSFLIQDNTKIKEYIMTENDLNIYNIKNTDSYEVKKIIDLSSLSTKTSETVKTALIDIANKLTPASKTYVCIIANTTGDGSISNWWNENQIKYANDYDKDAVLQEATNTRLGIQKLLNDKKSAGYNKLLLLPGIYRIDHKNPIYIPDNFTLDMNGSTFKQNQFAGESSTMISLSHNGFNSHLINGIIDGDYFSHDYSNSSNNSEWVNGLGMSGCSYSSFENIKVNNITGYGCATGRGDRYYNVKNVGTTTFGDIDRNTGNNIKSSTRTVSDFVDIGDNAKLDYITISKYLGYQGRSGDCWNMIVHFYDQFKNYIKSTDAYQYRKVRVPNKTKYIKVTLLNNIISSDLTVYLFSVPHHCSINNLEFNNVRAVGLAQSAMNDMLVSENIFTNCGQTAAKCAYDAEDGWDMMQDTTFKNNTFNYNPHNDFLICAGHNFIIDGQKNGKMYIWGRTRSLVVKNCNNAYIDLQGEGGKRNIVGQGIYRISNNNFSKGIVKNNLSKNNVVTSSISGLVYFSTLGSLENCSGSVFKNCTINPSNSSLGYINNIKMINCDFNTTKSFTNLYSLTLNNGSNNTRYFENCNFYGMYNLLVSGGTSSTVSTTFKNCYFENSQISIDTLRLKSGDLTLFENCNFNYKNNNFIFISPNAYDTGFFDTVKFNNCNITMTDQSNKSFIYCYAKPNGNFIFENCSISIPANITILDAYNSNKDKITNLILTFNNSPLPDNIKLISNYLSDNLNIKFNIS